MVIQNLERSYVVVQSCPGEGTARQYLCREETGGEWKEKKIVQVPLTEVSGSLIRFLMDQIHRESFHDFEDYFTDDSFLYVVMGLESGKRLDVRLQEEKGSLRERLEIGRKLIEQLVLLDMDAYFFKGAMAAERIRVSPALDISFDYDLSDIVSCESVGFDQGEARLKEVMDLLFSVERKQRAMPQLDTFCYGLAHGQWEDYLSIHGEYMKIYEQWIDKEEMDLRPRTWGFRFWEAVKAAARGLKNLVKAVIILLALAYLVLSIKEFVSPPAVRQNFRRIGTLQIEAEEESRTVGNEQAETAE